MHHLAQFIEISCGNSSLVVNKYINKVASLEEMANDNLCLQVVVHRVIALLSQLRYKLCRIVVTLVGRLHTLNVCQTIHEAV